MSGPVQAAVARELEIEGVVTERLASSSAVDYLLQGFRGNSDGVGDSDLLQSSDVFSGQGCDAESFRVGREIALGDQILEN